MSSRHLQWALEQRLPAIEKLMLISLASHAVADGTCWPLAADVARQSACSTRTVARKIKALIERRLIAVKETREGHVVVYQIAPDGVPA